MALVALTYLALMLWAGNMVAVPEEHDMAPGHTPGFLAIGWTQGPVAAWPTVEFWLPGPKVFGALSAGMVPVLITIAVLMGLCWAVAVHATGQHRRVARAGSTDQRPAVPMGRLSGLGTVGAAGINACCCCAPAMYPLLALVLGPTTGAAISAWFLGSSSPLFDLGLVAMLALPILALRNMLGRAEDPTPRGQRRGRTCDPAYAA